MTFRNELRRRELITLIGAAAAWPLAARAQKSDGVRHVAVLMSAEEVHVAAFRRALNALGWHESRNVAIEVRMAGGDMSRARGYAAELFEMTPDVFLATNTQMVQVIQEKTRSIPIVFVQVPDPVGSGFVESLARPGGNVTGFTNFDSSMGGKWVQLLQVAVLLQAGNPTAPAFLKTIEAAAPLFGIQVSAAIQSNGPGIDLAISSFANEPNGGLIAVPSALLILHRDQVIALAQQRRLPAIYPYSEFAAAGGLMSYGIDRKVLYEQAASYVDRILKGQKLSDLPVQTPTKFEFVVNLKTAKALGLKISDSFLLAANEIIEYAGGRVDSILVIYYDYHET
jgi:ABC-type uncharacterized transport system substrate-binding protein